MNDKRSLLCRSFFNGGEKPPTSEQYTQIWINLVNQIEKSKETVATVR
ncbi:MAG: hypothetical protein HDT37_04295 [Clostridiales bacterium]|nr:hypothetical protein [Clostridiales bacterium]